MSRFSNLRLMWLSGKSEEETLSLLTKSFECRKDKAMVQDVESEIKSCPPLQFPLYASVHILYTFHSNVHVYRMYIASSPFLYLYGNNFLIVMEVFFHYILWLPLPIIQSILPVTIMRHYLSGFK